MQLSIAEHAGATDVRASAPGSPGLELRRLGRVPYARAFETMERLRRERLAGSVQDLVLLLEHPDVITFGRGARAGNARLSDDELRAAGYEVFRVNRGGDVTWHGPGQLVGYPILDLARRQRDVHVYLRQLEGVLIDALRDFGVRGSRRSGFAGVWLDDATKIASIGVGLRRWITSHGFALNVSCDLARFSVIVPCGLEGVRMTSLAEALGGEVDFEAVTDRVAFHLQRVFG